MLKRREERFLKLASLIKPDLVIKLHVSPEVSLQRKPGELTFLAAKKNSELLRNINWGTITMNIDGNQTPKIVNKEIYNSIWSHRTI